MYDTLVKTKRVMNYVLSRLCTVLLVSMTLLVLWQVFTRYALNSPASFTEELVRYFLIWTGFIGAAYAFSTREHMALTFIRDRFSNENRRKIMIVVDVIIMVFALLVMLVGGVKLAIAAQMEYSALLGVPRSLVYSVAPLSGFFIVIIQIINLYEDITGCSLSPELLSEEEAAIMAAKEFEAEAEAHAHHGKNSGAGQGASQGAAGGTGHGADVGAGSSAGASTTASASASESSFHETADAKSSDDSKSNVNAAEAKS